MGVDIGELVLSVADAVIPLIFITAYGFLMVRVGLMGQTDIDAINTYVVRIGIPTMYFNALYQRRLQGEEFKYFSVYTLTSILVLGVVVVISLISNLFTETKDTGKTVESLPDIEDDDDDLHSMDNERAEEIKDKKGKKRTKNVDVRSQVEYKYCPHRKCCRLKPGHKSFRDTITDWVVCSYSNTVFVGQPLITCLIGDEAGERLPFLGDILFTIVIFPMYIALITYADIRNEKKEKNGEYNSSSGKKYVITNKNNNNSTDDYESWDGKSPKYKDPLVEAVLPEESFTSSQGLQNNNVRACIMDETDDSIVSDPLAFNPYPLNESLVTENLGEIDLQKAGIIDCNSTLIQRKKANNKRNTKQGSKCARCKEHPASKIVLRVIKFPLLHGIIIGLIVSYIPFTAPEMVGVLTKLVSNTCTPISMFSVGMFIAVQLKSLKIPRSFYHVAIKMFVAPMLTIGICKMLNMSDYYSRAAVTVISSTAASGSFAVLSQFKADPDKSPPAVVTGLILLFPQQIAIQLLNAYLFPDTTNPNDELEPSSTSFAA